MSDHPDEPYPIGYRRPPMATRFAAGRSGNPKGRPRGSKNLTTVMIAELDALVAVTENGKRRKVSKRQVIVRQLVNKAAGGDLKAIPLILAHAQAHEQSQAAAAAQDDRVSRADELGMAAFIARIRSLPLVPQSVPEPDAVIDAVVINDVAPDAVATAVPDQGGVNNNTI